MSDLISLTKMAPLLGKLAGSLAESAKGPAAKKKDELKVRFKVGFDEYISQQATRYSSVKTIIGSNIPLKLKDVYVNLYVAKDRHNNERVNIRDDDFLRIGGDLKRIVLAATAGAGKSMLMRYLFFLFLSEQSERLPVFIELRDINDYPDDSSILELIKDKVKEHISDFTLDQLKYALKEGMIALFLDGYDEIDHDRRIKRAREINSLAGRYNESIIFVSSRPDESFIGWERFNIYHISHFTENQVRSLIQKIPYEEDIKALFVKKLDAGLYETHKEFLVNPLLTLMMLITLEQFADVPAKIHLFYEYAFEALFARHDVTKSGGFQRKRHVSIALDDYRRLFSYFCTISYMKEAFRFTESTALEILSKSIASSQIDVRKEDMLEDLVQCTCMLTRDGLDYVFNHRSFQEYFVAYFFARIKVGEFERVAPRLMVRGSMDNVFLMMSEMNKEKFEESWALPQLNSLCEITKEIDAAANPIRFLKALTGSDNITLVLESDETGLMLGSLEDHDVIKLNTRLNLYIIYGVLGRLKELDPQRIADDKLILKKIREGEILKNDRRFNHFRTGGLGYVQIRITEADNEWCKGTGWTQYIVSEKRELFQLRAEVSERVEKRKKGLASILDF